MSVAHGLTGNKFIEILSNSLKKDLSILLNLFGNSHECAERSAAKEFISQFVSFREKTVLRSIKFDLKKTEARAHILEGLKKALEHIDVVIELIKKSSNPEEAKTKLIEKFKFTEPQTKAILDMRLQKLTSLETDKLIEELTGLQKQIVCIILSVNEITFLNF